MKFKKITLDIPAPKKSLSGEISEMMLDGTLCSCCGAYIGAGEGFPVQYSDCEDE